MSRCSVFVSVAVLLVGGQVANGQAPCCLPDGTCVITSQDNCENNLGGSYHGDETECGGMQACCDGFNATCSYTDALCCVHGPGGVPGIPLGPGTTCTPPEACCLLDNDYCIDVDPSCCVAVTAWSAQGPGTACTSPVACCFSDGSCQHRDPWCCDDEDGYPSPTGALVCLGDSNGDGIDDACALPPIPTVSEWGMVAMALLVLAAGAVVFARMKRQAA